MATPERPLSNPQPVEIVEHAPGWAGIAARLLSAIQSACAGVLLRVEHIGSTSVSGLAAKPVIDLMPVLAAFEDGARCVGPMEALGYDYRGEYGIPGRHYFSGWDAETGLRVHVHMLVEGSEPWRNHLLFRDFLRAHPSEAAAYAQVKRATAERHRNDREAYTDGKAWWVEGALERARAWAAETGRE